MNRHLKVAFTVSLLAFLAWIAPLAPLDPWNLLSPKKIFSMILALVIIQVLSSTLAQFLGDRTSALLTGFLGGLLSSTATTASLAKRSQNEKSLGESEILTFLAATGAMLFEGIALVIMGTTVLHSSPLVIFLGPILMTGILVFVFYRKMKNQSSFNEQAVFQIIPILKLALFIVTILAASKVAQNIFGQNGLLVLTSLVSLFEIHGSIIANVQLHESEILSVKFLCHLLALSIAASYVSKLFLILTLGSPALKSKVKKCTILLLFSVFISWIIALSV